VSGVWHFQLDKTESWSYWEDAFSPDECERIVAIGESQTLHKGRAGNEIKDIRKSEIAFLFANDDTRWIFERITGLVTSLNDRFFRFDLLGLAEGLQFTKYTAPGECYGRHIDNGLDVPVRKLSFTLQLSASEDYEGGDLCFYFSEQETQVQRKQGLVTVFPSWTLHEVKPVTKGTRYSLVAWVTGPPFK